MKKYLFSFFICGTILPLKAQQAVPVGIAAGLRMVSGFSYTGINVTATPVVYLGRHAIYAGPELSLSRTYFRERYIMGINAGYSYTVLRNRRWAAAVLADMQSFATMPYNPHQLPLNHKNRITEFQAGLGLYYSPSPLWRLGLEFGSGMYRERFQDVVEQKTRTSTGQTQLARLQIGLLLWRK